MKILFTAGGTGGHFYPIIAVAEAVEDISDEQKLVEPQLYYAAPTPYDRQMLAAHEITFVPTAAGKIRRYFSIRNFFDLFKTSWGILRSVIHVFFLYPDVVFGKGGYGSFPMLLAAKLFRIPVVIHESDAVPGRVNAWAGKFAAYIAISFDETSKYFPKDKVALTGVPVRKAVRFPAPDGAHEFLKLEKEIPTILVLGGSQGAAALNDCILEALPELLPKYQIVHQAGAGNSKEIEGRAKIILVGSPFADRYKPLGYLNDLAMKMSAGVAKVVVSRAGSTIFEIALWGMPSILVPLPPDVAADDHQTKNAYAYARTGAASVIEQQNLLPGVLVAEIDRIITRPDVAAHMSEAAKYFSRPDAAKVIAQKLLDIGLSHEQD
ncbi:MAG: UDP-N-acetylglucosamine--N-acetylmuramyl-(pentapeptide) pyrophosphoryl-undecaprenol N-acetylglucosamine transferase [Minisyncoccia bacterium]